MTTDFVDPQGVAQLRPAGEPDERVIVELEGVTKRFPGVVANDSISLKIRSGEVLCLLGENGAGKSTLISLLAGMQQPDEGRILIDGKPVRITSPKHAMRLGIGVVYQHSALIPTMTVLENIMLSDDSGVMLDRRAAKQRLEELSRSLDMSVDPDALTRDLGLGQQQQVEIAKAIWKGSRVLILDEPTSMLTPQAIEELEKNVAALKAQGLAVVLITHKMREAYAMGDAVDVLRGGRKVAEITRDELAGYGEAQARDRILAAMFGSSIEQVSDRAEAAEVAGASEEGGDHSDEVAARGDVVLQLAGVTSQGSGPDTPIVDVDLELRQGEILGIAGMDGHGQRALAETIAGQRQAVAGDVRLGDASITRLGVRARQRRGLRYVTDDRLHEGIVGNLSVATNLVIKQIGKRPFWRWGVLDRRATRDHATALIERYDIRTPSAEQRAGTLSGGNIQKLLLARELDGSPQVVVFHKPTYGLDLKTVFRVREIVREFAANGGAVLLISTDLDELVDLAPRIAVMSQGRFVGEVDNTDGTGAAAVGELMAGHMHAEGASDG
jgi:general nucleoside transport system ATP-binding protein